MSTTRTADVEALTRAYGREIFARAEAHDGMLPFGPDWLRGWIASFFAILLAGSLLLKYLWRLH